MEVSKLQVFRDHRGDFVQLFDGSSFAPVFVEDDISVNRKGVIRGIHGDRLTWKLVTAITGSFFVVVVDERREWKSFILSAPERLQVLIPPGHGLGYQALTEDAILYYKQSSKYGSAKQFTIGWDTLGVVWPITDPILSARDAGASTD